MLIAGALGGLAGTIEMLGVVHRYGDALSNDVGFVGVIIAVLAGRSEIGVLLLSIVFAVITVGGNVLQSGGASSDLTTAMFGVTLVFAALGQGAAHFRLVRSARSPVRPSLATVDPSQQSNLM